MSEESKNQETSGPFPPENEKRPGKKKKLIIGAIILIVLILILALVLHQCSKPEDEASEFLIGAGVKEGMMEGSGEAGEPGSNGKADMTIRMNGYPVFEDGESEGDLNIENALENVLYMEVEITLDDTGEVIYNSGYIPPNHYIDNDKLDVVLEKGEYNATAKVALVDPEDPDAPYNSANFNLVITINN